MLRALSPAIRYAPIEVDARRLARLRARLEEAGLADRLDDRLPDAPFDGVVIANEVLDALPVHRVRFGEGGLRELAVDVAPDGAFVEVEIEPTTPDLVAAAGRAKASSSPTARRRRSASRSTSGWRSAVAPLRRGLALLIDYGATAQELYDPLRRRDGTLRAYVRHQVSDDPYRLVGRQDLTAYVDVTAVRRAAEAAGLTTLGITTQAEALMGLGVEDRLREIQADPATTFEDYTLLRSALMRLLDPAAMGRFRVMVFGRAWPPDAPLRVLGYRLPRGTRGAAD